MVKFRTVNTKTTLILTFKVILMVKFKIRGRGVKCRPKLCMRACENGLKRQLAFLGGLHNNGL